MRIVLCADSREAELTTALSELGKVTLFSEYSIGLSLLGYYLRAPNHCDLLVVSVAGASGMNLCDKGRGEGNFPIIWISDQAEFEAQAKRMRVECFLTEPIPTAQITRVADRLLNRTGDSI